MEDYNDYTIYQQEYIDAIREEYEKPFIDIVDGHNNFIHPSAILGTNVVLGKNNYIGANCYIVGDVVIGDNNHFEAFCSIGTFPEHRSFFDKKKMVGVQIGDGNVFREFITINSGCYKPTKIGNKVWMLRGSHVGHDSEIEDSTTLSCNVLIGGHSLVGYGVNFGLGAICHQFSVIGSGSMIGMGAIVTKKSIIEPFKTYVGNPCKYIKENDYKVKSVTPTEFNDWLRFYRTQKINMQNLKNEINTIAK
jgi:UDP-N-acetylglucosamine acyltransferase